MSTSRYEPVLINLGVDACKQSFFAELAVTPKQSVVFAIGHVNDSRCSPSSLPPPNNPEGSPPISSISHKSSSGTVSLEARHYFKPLDPFKHNGGFISARVGNSGNIGFAVGTKTNSGKITCSPKVGVCYNIYSKHIKPILGVGIEFNI